MTTAAISLGITSAVTGVPSAIIDITNDHVNQAPDYYARIANNQMEMVYKQGKFINDFLTEALKVLDEESFKLSIDEQEEIEKILYVHFIFNAVMSHPKDETTAKTIKNLIRGFTATKGFLSAIAKAHDLVKHNRNDTKHEISTEGSFLYSKWHSR